MATAINDNGIGIGGVVLSISQTHAVRWDRHGRMTDLGSLTESDSGAIDINDRGTIIGFGGGRHAVLWRR